MPIEVRRFGVGYRRRHGPEGSVAVTGETIEASTGGAISELAIARGGRLAPHSSPQPSWFVVIEGGGWVGVGEEAIRVAAGEAVLWPAGLPHAAWTEHSPMRAIVVELAAPAGVGGDLIVEGGVATPIAPGETAETAAAGRPVSRGEGRLAPRESDAARHDRSAGEPI